MIIMWSLTVSNPHREVCIGWTQPAVDGRRNYTCIVDVHVLFVSFHSTGNLKYNYEVLSVDLSYPTVIFIYLLLLL